MIRWLYSIVVVFLIGLCFGYGVKGDSNKGLVVAKSETSSEVPFVVSCSHSDDPLKMNQQDKLRLRRNPFVSAISMARNGVVSVSVTQLKYYHYTIDPYFEMFFPGMGMNIPYRISSMGSGFIVDDDGYVITNAHVVDNAREIYINLPDGREFKGELVGMDPITDIAVVKIEGDSLPCCHVGNSDDIMIGEYAIAIGNPFGFILSESGPTVTCGWISATNRNIKFEQDGKYYKNMIQTNADINQGNSGGPLVNILGEVIGVNTFILTQGNSGSIGIGFAMPINKAIRIMDEIITFGKVRTAWIGMDIHDMDERLARFLRLDEPVGGIVYYLEENSPSAKAGIRKKDVIIGINGKKLKNRNEILDELFYYQVGDTLNISLIRNAKPITVHLVLKEIPKQRMRKKTF